MFKKKENGFSLVELSVAAAVAVGLAVVAVSVVSGTASSVSAKGSSAASVESCTISESLAKAGGDAAVNSCISGSAGASSSSTSSTPSPSPSPSASSTAPTWSTASTLTNGYKSASYNFTLNATDAEAHAISYNLLSGQLPNGLSLGSSGIISGTPSTAGTFNFTVQAKDSTGLSTNRDFSLTIVNTTSWATDGSRVIAKKPDYYYYGIAVNPSDIVTQWQYAITGSGSWSNFGGLNTRVDLATPVVINGVVYTQVEYSAPWTPGNNNYNQRVYVNGVEFLSGGEVNALARNAYGNF
jgi:type II secretory pathway pseudopilin PulG